MTFWSEVQSSIDCGILKDRDNTLHMTEHQGVWFNSLLSRGSSYLCDVYKKKKMAFQETPEKTLPFSPVPILSYRNSEHSNSIKCVPQ